MFTISEDNQLPSVNASRFDEIHSIAMNYVFEYIVGISHTLLFSSSIRTRGIVDLFSENAPVIIASKIHKTMSQARKMYPCTCADCGKDSEVPFEPKQDRPVYCKECLPKHRK